MTRQRRRDDEGAILIIAIAIISVVALVTGFLLTQTGGNFVATVQLREVARTSYAADAAANVAINNLRLGEDAPGAVTDNLREHWVFNDDVDGSGCFGRSGSAPIDDIVMNNAFDTIPQGEAPGNDTSARVVCTPVAGTGIFGTGSGVDVNNNGNGRALTTLKPGSGSISVSPQGSGNDKEMWIRGSVAANGTITASHGPFRSNGTIWGNGCSGTITGDQGTNCSYGTVSDPMSGRNPNISSVPTLQDDLDCSLEPGYYDDAAALSTLTTSTCATTTFAPGNYYFDFHNEDLPSDFLTGTNVWTINKRVRGGQSSGKPIPESCRSPIDHTDADGVQFVFGGTSRIALGNDAQVELCGTYSTGSPPIVLYGLRSGTADPPVNRSAAPGTVTQPAGQIQWTNATPPALAATGGAASGWTNMTAGVPSSQNQSAKLTLTAITPTPAIPAGAILTNATLKVTRTSTGSGLSSFTATVDAGAATSGAKNLSGTGDHDVTAVLAKAVHDGDLSATVPTITIDIDAKKDKEATVSIDKVELALTFVAPALRSHQPPSPFLVNNSSFKGAFVVQGATYVPRGDFDMVVTNDRDEESITAFRYGMVANSVNFKGLPQYPYAYPIVSIPELGPGFGPNVTAVDLKVYVCPGAGSCAASDANLALTSRVKITDDPDLPVPVPGERRIEVLSWSEQH